MENGKAEIPPTTSNDRDRREEERTSRERGDLGQTPKQALCIPRRQMEGRSAMPTTARMELVVETAAEFTSASSACRRSTTAMHAHSRRAKKQLAPARKPHTDNRQAAVSHGRPGMKATGLPIQCMCCIFLLVSNAKRMCGTTLNSWRDEIMCDSKACKSISFVMKGMTSSRRKFGTGYSGNCSLAWSICSWWPRLATPTAVPGVNTEYVGARVHFGILIFRTGSLG